MSTLSPQPSLITSSPLLLHSVSSTLLIALSVVLIYLAPRFARSIRSNAIPCGDKTAISLALTSTLILALYGICGLVAIGDGSFSAAVAGGILGTLSLLTADSQAIVTALAPRFAGSQSSKQSFWVATSLASLLLVSTTLQVTLLALEQPSQETLFGLTHARAIFHLVFDLAIAAILVKRLIWLASAGAGADVESQLANDASAVVTVELKPAATEKASGVLGLMRRREVLSTLLSILTMSIPTIQNFVPINSTESRYIPPTVFGSTSTPGGSIALSIFIALKWSGSLFELSSVSPSGLPIDLEAGDSGARSERLQEPAPLHALEPGSTATSIHYDSEDSKALHTPESSTSTSNRLFTERSRSHSVSSLLSFGANLPPRISEECERSNREDGSCGNTDNSEDYVHTETFPAPFAIELDRRLSRCSPNRPRSTSSPEQCRQPVTTRTPSPVIPRTRKDAGRLSRPTLDRPDSCASSFGNDSPVLARPALSIDVTPEDAYHSAVPYTPTRSVPPESTGRSTPSPTKYRRPSLRSLVGISSPRLPSAESTTSPRGARRGSRSSSISYLRGRYVNDGAVTPTLEIETDEEDPFAAVQASQAVEATRKVEEWAKRRAASERETLATDGGGFEEDIEIVSPTRESFERLHSPIRITTSALAHLHDPSLHPRGRSPSSSNSLFHEHLSSSPRSPDARRDEHRVRSGSLASAFTFASTTKVVPSQSTPPYRFGKSFSASPPFSPPSTSTRLLEAIGIRSSPSRPPRADSLSSRPVSSQVERKEESPEQVRARTRSSAPPPSTSDCASPRTSPVRRLFARRPSASVRLFSSSPPTISYPSPIVPQQSRKGSRASSTFSSASFSLSKLRRGSNAGILRPSLGQFGGAGGGTAQCQVSTGSLGMATTSDLSFACRGEGGSSFQSSARPSLSRSVSLDFQIGASSHPSTRSRSLGEASALAEDPVIEPASMASSPTRTTNWWTQTTFDSRPLTPYRHSSRRQAVTRLRSTSAPVPFDKTRGSNSSDSLDGNRATAPQRPQARRARSQSVPLDRLSRYQLGTPPRVSPIGSLVISLDDESDDPGLIPSTRLGPPIVLAQPPSKAPSARSSLSLALSHIERDSKKSTSREDKTISLGDLQELTQLYETFTPLGPLEHQVVSTRGTSSSATTPTTCESSPSTYAASSPGWWPSTHAPSLSTAPSSTCLSISSGSPTLSPPLTSPWPSSGGSTFDYWRLDGENPRATEDDDREQECLEAAGEGAEMF
ncbi:hypothetical protein JCM11491_002317 [Sporobolomyces phaffii]